MGKGMVRGSDEEERRVTATPRKKTDGPFTSLANSLQPLGRHRFPSSRSRELPVGQQSDCPRRLSVRLRFARAQILCAGLWQVLYVVQYTSSAHSQAVCPAIYLALLAEPHMMRDLVAAVPSGRPQCFSEVATWMAIRSPAG